MYTLNASYKTAKRCLVETITKLHKHVCVVKSELKS